MKRKESGITLVALVVTIIVLIILAAITMTFVLGENGILTRSKQASKATKEAQDIENIDLNNLEREIGNYDVMTNTHDTNPGVLSGEGTAENPYLIESIEDLVQLSVDMYNGEKTYEGKTVKLGLTLDFNEDASYVNSHSKDFGDFNRDGVVDELKTELTTSTGWMPIGCYQYAFKGNFDGNNKQILNLYMNRLSNERLYFKLSSYGFMAGSEGNITNLAVSGKIKINLTTPINDMQVYIGGIVGKDLKQFDKVVNNVNIEVVQNDNSANNITVIAGGLVGHGSHFSSCVNNGNIKVQANENKKLSCTIGGIEGIGSQNNGIGVINNGQIEVYNLKSGNIAGITAYLYVGYIKDAENNGKIITSGCLSGTSNVFERVGGIVGESYIGKIYEAHNKGDIKVIRENETLNYQYSIGGIIAKDSLSSHILNAINEGNILYNTDSKYISQIGGIAGGNTLGNSGVGWRIENAINLGNIEINDTNTDINDEHHIDVAGILGKSEYTATIGLDCNFNNLYNQGNIRVNSNANDRVNIAGIFGDNTQDNTAKINANNLMNKGNFEIDDAHVNKIGFISSSTYNFNTVSNIYVDNNITYAGIKKASNSTESSISSIDMNADNVLSKMNSNLGTNFKTWKNDNGKVSLEF